MRPKIDDVKTAVGAENEGVFVRFVASTRNSKLTRSVILNCLLKEASVWKYAGWMKKLRPVLPIEPGAGALNLALASASNQKFLPLSTTRLPISREQPLQSAVEFTTLLKVVNPE